MNVTLALLGISQTYRDAVSCAVSAFNLRKAAAIERSRARVLAERSAADAECMLDDLASLGVSQSVATAVLAARLHRNNLAEQSYTSAIGEDFQEEW